MVALHSLIKLVKKPKRIGRGGSRGGTSGKGHKGQSARSGGSVGGIFEGGQMPLARRLPKRGFNNVMFKKCFEIVNLGDLEKHFTAGETVDRLILAQKGLIKGCKAHGVKVLGTGSLKKKLTLNVNACSKTAREAIEQAGGVVTIL